MNSHAVSRYGFGVLSVNCGRHDMTHFVLCDLGADKFYSFEHFSADAI